LTGSLTIPANNAWSSYTVTPPIAGTFRYSFTCNNSAGQSNTASVDVTVNPSTTPAPTLNFSASPTSITSGQSSTLTWSTTNATSCSASGGWSTSKSTSGSQIIYPSSTTIYVLYCYGSGEGIPVIGTTATVIVNGIPAVPIPTLNFSASPTSITSGQSSTLTWSTTNATSCSASGGWSGTKLTSGSQIIYPTSTITYTLSCSGTGGGTTINSANVEVNSSTTSRSTTDIQTQLNALLAQLRTLQAQLKAQEAGAVNNTPIGTHDEVNNSACSTKGWAYDPDTSSSSISIDIYRDGGAGSGVNLGRFTTNLYRSDINATKGISGNHGFEVSLPSSLKDGVNHSLYVYAIDSSGVGTNPLLSNSPKTIQCVAPAPPAADIQAQLNALLAQLQVLQAQMRDMQRLEDLSALNAALTLYVSTVSNGFSSCQSGMIYRSNNGSDSINGAGWLPVDFTKISGGSPLSRLPVDLDHPRNYYAFACDSKDQKFELNSILESSKYKSYLADDGGSNSTIYERGSDLNLIK